MKFPELTAEILAEFDEKFEDDSGCMEYAGAIFIKEKKLPARKEDIKAFLSQAIARSCECAIEAVKIEKIKGNIGGRGKAINEMVEKAEQKEREFLTK